MKIFNCQFSYLFKSLFHKTNFYFSFIFVLFLKISVIWFAWLFFLIFSLNWLHWLIGLLLHAADSALWEKGIGPSSCKWFAGHGFLRKRMSDSYYIMKHIWFNYFHYFPDPRTSCFASNPIFSIHMVQMTEENKY